MSTGSKEKTKLYELTNDFQRGLVSMLVGRPNRENSLSAVLNEVVDCHRMMGLIHQEQSKADELIVQLAIDYEKLVVSAKAVMSVRLKYQHGMEKSQKGKNPLEEIEKKRIVEFDMNRRAAMVSNLLVVLCSERNAQPVMETGF